MSIAERISEQKPESSLIKSPSEKLIKFILFGVDVDELDHAVQWHCAVAITRHALRAALNIVNIDFELN